MRTFLPSSDFFIPRVLDKLHIHYDHTKDDSDNEYNTGRHMAACL